MAHVAPPMVSFLAKRPAVKAVLPLPKLRELVSGAAPLSTKLSDAVKKRLNTTLVVRQGHEMTELSPASHIGDIHWRDSPGSAGRRLGGIVCKVEHPETGACIGVGPDQVGKLWVRGERVMLGHLNNPGATAETIDAEGFLHTGDMGYVDANGTYFIVDRLKELIEVKGFQVAPAELEVLM